VLVIVALQPLPGSAASPRPVPGTPGATTPGDPWERSNRRRFAFNQMLDRRYIRPLSRLTMALTPGPLGKMIHNFMVNLKEPVVVVNDLLQAKPLRAFKSAFRFVVNTTAGGLGAIDVAKALGDPVQPNGFGDTLARWGVGPGPYLYLPVLGPSTPRDLFGGLADNATVPLQIVQFPYQLEVNITVGVVGGVNERGEIAKSYDALLSQAADPYASLRSAYLQSREAEIRGEKALPALPDIEEAAPEPATAGPADSESSPISPAGEAPAPATPPTAPPPEATAPVTMQPIPNPPEKARATHARKALRHKAEEKTAGQK
jgi:phospholipid-binding lipoprotein MlaA